MNEKNIVDNSEHKIEDIMFMITFIIIGFLAVVIVLGVLVNV
jgi:hypothetical protein